MVRVLEIQDILRDNLAGQRADKILIDARALYEFVYSPDFTMQGLLGFAKDCRHMAFKGSEWLK